jgi:hypothetical protein
MSEDKIDVHIEIGPNLKDVLIHITDNTYKLNGFESEQIVGSFFSNLSNFVSNIIKIKNPTKKVEIECPMSNKREE